MKLGGRLLLMALALIACGRATETAVPTPAVASALCVTLTEFDQEINEWASRYFRSTALVVPLLESEEISRPQCNRLGGLAKDLEELSKAPDKDIEDRKSALVDSLEEGVSQCLQRDYAAAEVQFVETKLAIYRLSKLLLERYSCSSNTEVDSFRNRTHDEIVNFCKTFSPEAATLTEHTKQLKSLLEEARKIKGYLPEAPMFGYRTERELLERNQEFIMKLREIRAPLYHRDFAEVRQSLDEVTVELESESWARYTETEREAVEDTVRIAKSLAAPLDSLIEACSAFSQVTITAGLLELSDPVLREDIASITDGLLSAQKACTSTEDRFSGVAAKIQPLHNKIEKRYDFGECLFSRGGRETAESKGQS